MCDCYMTVIMNCCFKIRTNALNLISAIPMPLVQTQKALTSARVCSVTLGMVKPVSGIKVNSVQILQTLINIHLRCFALNSWFDY